MLTTVFALLVQMDFNKYFCDCLNNWNEKK